MSLTLRIFLIVASILAVVYTLRKIRKTQMNIDDSLYWIIISVLLLILSIFPQVAEWAAGLFGFVGVVNFVFFFMIAAVIVKLFQLSVDLSVTKHRLNSLVQKIALYNKETQDTIIITANRQTESKERERDNEHVEIIKS